MSPRKELVGIQYLRGVAVLLVVFDHIEGMLAMPKYFGGQFAGGLFSAGTVGVDLFFVISGFIIFHVTGGLNRSTISPAQFAIRRFCRVVPFMWAYVIFHFTSRALTVGHIDAYPYFRALLLYPTGSVNPNQIWTLRHEALFYLFAGLALLGPVNRIWLVAFLLTPIAWAFYTPEFAINPEGASWLSEIFSFRSNLAFALGIGVAYLYRISKNPTLPEPAAILVVFLSPVFLLGLGRLSATWQASAPLSSSIIVSLACTALVLLTLGIQEGGSWPHKFGMLLGSASYSIYLTHDTVISLSASLLRRLHVESVLAASLSISALVIVFGISVHLTIEKFIVDRSRRFLELRADIK